MKTNKLDEIFKNVYCEDVPNLGSIITLDNKGRLINSQFSKPSSSQTLLKLNSIEEVPDADDLPYSIISYGDTLNIINLPYNDHNYCCVRNSKKNENYDKKALDYISKQSSKSSNRINFSTNSSVRISHFSSYNASVSQNDAVFFPDKYKSQNQFTFNQQISHSSTPIVTNKSMSSISQNNNVYSKNKIIPSTIVINSGSINKGKNMNVIQLRRPTIDANNINETRIINLPMKKPSVLTNIMANNQINGDREINGNKAELLKSINLIPRCVCAFTHDDGGMIRCEICRTWQHIVCMYPDNKFPIYYKCERCEPRDVDIRRAVTTQKNILIKTGYNPSDFVAHKQFNEYDLDNDNLENNNFTKSTNGSHYVIVKPDIKSVSYRSATESMPNTSMPIFISATKDPQTVTTGSPRTSKRKQDLISLKSVLTKPLTLNTNNVSCKIDLPKPPLPADNYNPMGGYYVSTSNQKLLLEHNESLSTVNDMSDKLKSILSNRVQFHTNLTIYHTQYLKQNNFVINTNMYEVVLIDFTRYAVKAVVEFNSSEIIMEYNGFVSLAEEYNKERDFRKHYSPYVLFYDKFDHLHLCIDSKDSENKSRYVRRSCTPNAEVKHRLLQDGQIRFYIVPINRIGKDSEITIAFDYNFMKCRYPVECACNHPSCQLVYLKLETEYQSQRSVNDIDSHNMNMYECANINLSTENVRAPVSMTRPYKKRGRGSKVLIASNRPIDDNVTASVPKSDIKVVRRNKRGRPPLNRSVGITRADIVVKTQSESSASNNTPNGKLKDSSDNESVHSESNENIHPKISIHSNFKNFRRISSSHWSLKTNRKMAAIAKKSKPLKKLLISPKVGRPLKHKKIEPVKYESEPEYPSDHSEPEKPVKTLAKQSKSYYNDDYDGSTSPHSIKEDMSRDEEGKYWLQEINNKILKQKEKEAKKIKRKSKYGKKKMNKHEYSEAVDCGIAPEKLFEPEIIKLPNKELKEEKISHDEACKTPPVNNDKKEQYQVVKKVKRGRKSQKPNTNYILSYKPSNIDDLKNDLMLISASFDEDTEKNLEVEDPIKEECEVFVNEVIIEETVENNEEPVEHIEEPSYESVEQTSENNVTKDTESDASLRMSESLDDKSASSRSKRSSLNKSSDSAREMAAKASREERWVNTMWQRILKIENTDDKSKRRRGKSSAADGSVASEENRNESSEIGSPKLSNCELSDDRDSSSAQKHRRKMKFSHSEYDDNYQEEVSVSVNERNDVSHAISTTSSGSIDEHQSMEHKENSEQCGLIVYKEQHSNPMEKFSRENSAKLSTQESIVDGLTATSNVPHPPHAKKRWLSQALMEETSCEETSMPKTEVVMADDIMDKLTSIDSVSKRSFLPPIFTSAENSDSSIINLQKIAINPKKRLLNQFSMEDNTLKAYIDPVHFKSRKKEANIDQEQAKTKLTLSEYRKRRFNDKVLSKESPTLTKYSKMSEDFNNGWVGIRNVTPEIEKMAEEEFTVCYDEISGTEKTSEERVNLDKSVKGNCERILNTTEKCDSIEPSHCTELSYLDTLNNLPMPSNLDPRLSRVKLLSTGAASPNFDNHDLRVISYHDSVDFTTTEIFEPKSPSDTPDSDNEDRMYINGPRTPSENEAMTPNIRQRICSSIGRQSGGSEHSFESQPSPTSDSHFDFEKDVNPVADNEKPSSETAVAWPTDWTCHASSIGRMAGIKNPELLQEIEEFEDEYFPLPDNIPERTKDEIETLLLTQKRDSQIREWQEVKQLEREKVKLDHQVRSMERRLHHRTNKHISAEQRKRVPDKRNPMADYDVKNDEKTMKAFNVQLVNINGQLMAQINSLKVTEDSNTEPRYSETRDNKAHSRDRRKEMTVNGRQSLSLRPLPSPPPPSSSEIRSTIL